MNHNERLLFIGNIRRHGRGDLHPALLPTLLSFKKEASTLV